MTTTAGESRACYRAVAVAYFLALSLTDLMVRKMRHIKESCLLMRILSTFLDGLRFSYMHENIMKMRRTTDYGFLEDNARMSYLFAGFAGWHLGAGSLTT